MIEKFQKRLKAQVLTLNFNTKIRFGTKIRIGNKILDTFLVLKSHKIWEHTCIREVTILI